MAEPYLSDKKYSTLSLVNTETIANEVVVFPNGYQLKKSDVKFRDLFIEFNDNELLIMNLLSN